MKTYPLFNKTKKGKGKFFVKKGDSHGEGIVWAKERHEQDQMLHFP
jgi:hypothetical protein